MTVNYTDFVVYCTYVHNYVNAIACMYISRYRWMHVRVGISVMVPIRTSGYFSRHHNNFEDLLVLHTPTIAMFLGNHPPLPPSGRHVHTPLTEHSHTHSIN